MLWEKLRVLAISCNRLEFVGKAWKFAEALNSRKFYLDQNSSRNSRPLGCLTCSSCCFDTIQTRTPINSRSRRCQSPPQALTHSPDPIFVVVIVFVSITDVSFRFCLLHSPEFRKHSETGQASTSIPAPRLSSHFPCSFIKIFIVTIGKQKTLVAVQSAVPSLSHTKGD